MEYVEFNMITFLEMDYVEARRAPLGCFLFPFLGKTLLLWLLFQKKTKQDIDVKYVSFYYFRTLFPSHSFFPFSIETLSSPLCIQSPFFILAFFSETTIKIISNFVIKVHKKIAGKAIDKYVSIPSDCGRDGVLNLKIHKQLLFQFKDTGNKYFMLKKIKFLKCIFMAYYLIFGFNERIENKD